MFRLLSRNNVPQWQMVRHLVTDPKYRFLKQLGLTSENPGLYDGQWGGSGKVFFFILFFIYFFFFLREFYLFHYYYLKLFFNTNKLIKL